MNSPLRQPPSPGLLADAGHTLATSLQLIVVGLGTSVVLARFLGPGGKGAYDLAMATAGLIATLGGLSLHSGLTYFVARSAIRVRAFLGSLIAYDLVLAAVGGGLLWLFYDQALHDLLLPPHLGLGTVAVLALIAGTLAGGAQFRAVLVGLGCVPEANVRNLIQNVAFLALLSAAALWSMMGPGSATYHLVLWFALATNVLGIFLFLGVVMRTPDPSGPQGFKPVVRYSLHAHSSNVAQFLNYRLDFFFVSFFIGVSAVGLYAVAVGLSSLLWIASRAASQVLLPKVAAADDSGAGSTAVVTRLSLGVALVGGLGLLVGGAPLLRLLYGTEFVGSYQPLMLLLIGVIPFTVSNTLAAHLGGMGLPQLNFRASLAGLVVTIILDLLLIPQYGIGGAAIATSISYLVTTLILVILFHQRTSLPLRELFLPQRQDAELLREVFRGIFKAFRGRGTEKP